MFWFHAWLRTVGVPVVQRPEEAMGSAETEATDGREPQKMLGVEPVSSGRAAGILDH